MFFYSETAPREKTDINVWKMNGTKGYLRHYDNYLYLNFVASNPRSTMEEKRQANKELAICERKLTFWRRHPNYVHEDALKGVEALKRNWRSAA